jgi:hypothetical protein
MKAAKLDEKHGIGYPKQLERASSEKEFVAVVQEDSKPVQAMK